MPEPLRCGHPVAERRLVVYLHYCWDIAEVSGRAVTLSAMQRMCRAIERLVCRVDVQIKNRVLTSTPNELEEERDWLRVQGLCRVYPKLSDQAPCISADRDF